MELVNQLVT